jgi:class 3 adenylate cyclase/tetratricopeptide (TPR) repeat protein
VREQRKIVTVLFADVVGSTALAAMSDPEVVRTLMARYFQRIAEISSAHGGTVEKFAGDAAMVVFGVPAVHDDDAERAVRAALEIRDGAAELAVRVGVNTGEAVTAARDDRQFMVSGDAVNIAARLQQGAEPGEVLVGALTAQLTRNAIDYEPSDPVVAKGKAQPLVAFRAVRPRTLVPVQARGVPGLHAELVGRERELRLLVDTFARTAEDRRTHLFTLIGAAGVGKSRLVTEALAALSGSGARLLRGRCLPYGRGVTYWPFVEMLGQDTGIALADERGAALAKLDRWLGELLAGDPQRPAIRARLAVMMGVEAPATGLPDTPADRIDKEIAWGVRRYLEAIAKAAPLIVVVDDVQWAEPPMIQLLEQLAERTVDVPLLLICIGRPEFLEARRDWSAGKPNSSTITLDPLSQEQTGMLISRLLEIEALPADLRAQIIERSAGTPLFCEEFIQMLIDEGRLVRDGASWKATGEIEHIRVPESIQAVLAARLDGLPDGEKAVLQAASVIGERFQVEQVAALMAGANQDAAFESLRRKGLVAGGDDDPNQEVRFRHLLIRDAAYASLTKSERVALHDRFGSILETEAGDPTQMTEILAHHAERALTLSIELALDGDMLLSRAQRALEWSLAMGERAITRRDLPTVDAALNTARAAAAALPGGGGLESRSRVSLLEAQLLVVTGDYATATQAAAKAAALAEEAQLLQLVATARLTEAWIANWAGAGSMAEFDRLVERAIAACQRAGDAAGEIEARHVGANHLFSIGRLDEFVAVNEGLLAQAKAIGDHGRSAAILIRLANTEGMRLDLRAADRYLFEADALAAQHGLRNVALSAYMPHGDRLLLSGDIGAEQIFRDYIAAAHEAGSVQHEMSALRFLGYSLMFQRRYKDANDVFDRAIQLSESSGERWNRTELLALKARTSLEIGDLETAQELMDRALEMSRDDDVTATSEVSNHLGLLRVAQGREEEGEAALRKSLDAVAGTDYEWPRTLSALALARFLAERSRTAEAAELLEERSRWLGGRDVHLWDREIEEIRALVATRQPS